MNATIVSFGLSTNVWEKPIFRLVTFIIKCFIRKLIKLLLNFFRKILSLSWNMSKCWGVWQKLC
jgi:hypothetical protein